MNLCKTNLASSDKDWLKNSSADYLSGKQPAKSLELLREKIGQLRNGGALKQSSPKTASTLDHHSVGESHSRGHTPSIFESSVHVYRDEKVLNSGGTLKEKMKPESHTRKDEVYSRNISPPFLEYEKNSIEQNYDDRESPVSFSTPSISFTGKGNGSSLQSYISRQEWNFAEQEFLLLIILTFQVCAGIFVLCFSSFFCVFS